jgi:hypothetical protein
MTFSALIRLSVASGALLALGLSAVTLASAAEPAGIIRIVAGLSEPLKDEAGNTWLPGKGFIDGETNYRPDTPIANTKIPSVYRAERFNFSKFAHKLPNGNYTVKLHFAITYEAIDGPGQVVFSFDVEGKKFKDYDVFAKAGGARRALIETVPVTVTDGELTIAFTAQLENTFICGVEIIPAP